MERRKGQEVKRHMVIAYVLAYVAALAFFHWWGWRHGEPEGGYVPVELSGAQLILIVTGLIGIGVVIGRSWKAK